MTKLLVTGGAGFIGSNFLHYWTKKYPSDQIIVLDSLTYSGVISNILPQIEKKLIHFVNGDICDKNFVKDLFKQYCFDKIIHFAAESHVDRSIHSPSKFIETNILGTYSLLSASLEMWENNFKGKVFHHISTDEVYGELNDNDPPFTEISAYAPNSLYAASKSSSDMLVRAYNKTYGLPTVISNCSNNYGPYQFPEKLIPLMIINILEGNVLPIYGNGSNIRDWLYVNDHCTAIDLILNSGKIGETYNVGGMSEITNLELVIDLCSKIDFKIDKNDELSKRFPNNLRVKGKSSETLIRYVTDRPGHDYRYAINPKKICTEMNFKPAINFEKGINFTIDWYLKNEKWWRAIMNGKHSDWIKKQYNENT